LAKDSKFQQIDPYGELNW